ncbi:MAG: methyl-accepting chemotaxis protein [Lachnospiraceae bacterium]|nr:methyl-accepting chemotaxis protein [Lachnospiraceae bacterium]
MSKQKKEEGQKRITVQLLARLILMVTTAMVVVTAFITINASGVIKDKVKEGLYQESRANSEDISQMMAGVKNYYDGLADSIEDANFENDQQILDTLADSMKKYEGEVSDVYIGLADKTFLDGGGWIPDADYDPTTRGWYTDGVDKDEMTFLDPSMDMVTKKIVVCCARKIELKDGRKGVISIDVVLAGVSKTASSFKPLKTGSSMLYSGETIIASPASKQVGKTISDYKDDNFLQDVNTYLKKGGSKNVEIIEGTDGNTYYISFNKVDGTDWILTSHVVESVVMKPVYKFVYLTIIITVVILLIGAVLMVEICQRMIAKPVNKLTDTITCITDGDFSVDIEEDANKNEIGIMNDMMARYVKKMRKQMEGIKIVSDKLTEEAGNSKSASETLNEKANEQSHAMQQIHGVMDGMADAVVELANNATTLAQEITDLSERSSTTKETMESLVDKAKNGQTDMERVQTGMKTIAESMDNMNEVVVRVDESAKQINSIIDIISSISEQTNLLSLNASIEAARAGEAGRGFAVVASEIGSLAQNSAESTKQIFDIVKEITGQIQQLSESSKENQAKIEESVEAVNMAGSTFEEIFENLDEAGTIINEMIDRVTKVDEIATNVAAISEEQSASTEEVTATTTDLASSAEAVADSSLGVDRSATTVSDSAGKIADFLNIFKF